MALFGLSDDLRAALLARLQAPAQGMTAAPGPAFGGLANNGEPAPQPQYGKIASAAPQAALGRPPPQGGGLFGQLLQPNNLQIIGATLRQLGGASGALDDVAAQQRLGRLDAANLQHQQAADQWQREQQGRQRGIWSAQDRFGAALPSEQRDLYSADPAGFIGARRGQDQYAWQRTYDAEHPEPITPAQREGFRLTQRGQDLSYAAAAQAAAARAPAYLRGGDAALMTRARQAAESSRGLMGLVGEFEDHLARAQTAPGSGVQVWNPDIRAMTALAARMTGMMRPTGSGATSDFEQRLYARGAPSVDNTAEANRSIIDGIRKLAQIQDARQFFYEDYADAHGNLNGAERAFQASEDFRRLTGGAPAMLPNGGQGFTNQRGQTVNGNNDPLGIR